MAWSSTWEYMNDVLRWNVAALGGASDENKQVFGWRSRFRLLRMCQTTEISHPQYVVR
jgi:hypothetical protein